MSGIYIHIPFCKTKCTYCDFYSNTNFQQKKRVLNTIHTEIGHRKNYLSDKNISTIYFGGGTPSTLSIEEIQDILHKIKTYFIVLPDAEITLESNPDDLSDNYLKSIRAIGINRISIGIQSFDNSQLSFINRRHDASGAVQAVQQAQRAGFDNISIDLIYGLPGQTIESWQEQLEKAFTLDVQHISAYGLTYEPDTPLWKQQQQGKVVATDEDTIIKMYEILVDRCTKKRFEQYEISNFAKNGFRSRHNSSYWQQIPYLGIGPSAHSYDGDSRQWNTSSMGLYCQNIEQNRPYFEREKLTPNEKYNDYIMVRLRTCEGINLNIVNNLFGENAVQLLLKSSKKYLQNKLLIHKNNFLCLSQAGILVSNLIIEDLMME
ncbi:MAG: radical SAM family heme chaperone HemW [Paludibacteraceae bacterium]